MEINLRQLQRGQQQVNKKQRQQHVQETPFYTTLLSRGIRNNAKAGETKGIIYRCLRTDGPTSFSGYQLSYTAHPQPKMVVQCGT